MTSNEQAVASTLQEYERALNAADTNAVMLLYTDDGIFMAPYSASAVGREAVRKAYDTVFSAIRLTVTFHVAEVVEMSSDWVYARTNSGGATLDHATGTTTAEANQELFIFRKEANGKFRIARYSFSSTNPRSK